MEIIQTPDTAPTYQNAWQIVERLAISEQLQLVEAVMQKLRRELPASSKKQHSILELRGLGKEIWQQIDVDEYIQQERDSWDGPNHSIMPQSD
jgi:hypothetical protein